jgi:hypothetical protein
MAPAIEGGSCVRCAERNGAPPSDRLMAPVAAEAHHVNLAATEDRSAGNDLLL